MKKRQREAQKRVYSHAHTLQLDDEQQHTNGHYRNMMHIHTFILAFIRTARALLSALPRSDIG